MSSNVTAPSASERFAAHVAKLRLEDLPDDAVAQAKVFILDTLGVGIAGSSAFGAPELLRAAKGWGAGEEATVWGRRERLPAPTAAFLNGFHVHCQEFDCVCDPAVLHPLATLLPAALAVADREGGVSGRTLLEAVAAGTDVAGWLGIASQSPLRFFRPATAGGFGATAAIAKLRGLDASMLAHAFGLQYAQTSGTMQPHIEASPTLPMQVGFNARAAVSSVDLALTGLSAPRFSLDGPFGYLPLMEGDFDLDPVWRQLGRRFLVAELSHKPYPAGRATHAGIEGVGELQTAHGFSADDVAEVVVSGPPVIARLTGRPDQRAPTPNYARLCMAFVVAKMLRNGRVDLADYRGDALTDAATHDLAARIRTLDDGNPDPNALAPQDVTVRLHDGTTLHWHCDALLASPTRRLTRERHLAKFRRCLEFAADLLPPSAADELIAGVDALETIKDVRELTELLGSH
jgi:2-methylcitrate dehydratase PrpD